MVVQRAEDLGRGIYRIDEFSLVNAFVIEGGERIAVVDTGYGYGNIRKVVEGISGKPVSVILTHMHPDHTGGIYHFRDCPVYASGLDRDERIFGMENDNAFRRMYLETRGAVNCPDLCRSLFALIPEEEPDPSFEYITVGDGTLMDLGGRKLTCIYTPGHTRGSVSYLDHESRVLFSGDAVNSSIILPRKEGGSLVLVEELGSTLARLWEMRDSFDFLAIGHGGPLASKELIHDYLVMVEGLLSGSLAGRYEEKGFRKGEVVRHGMAELWYRCDE